MALLAQTCSHRVTRMSRNEHHRTPLHHAAAKNRPRMVRLLLDLGADPNASDAIGTTALTTASHEHTDPAIITMLLAAGAKLDFMSALYLEGYEAAEAMLKGDPSRIGPDGRDTIAFAPFGEQEERHRGALADRPRRGQSTPSGTYGTATTRRCT